MGRLAIRCHRSRPFRSSASLSAAATPSSSSCTTTAATRCSARRSTTRRERRSTRSAACWTCPTRAGRPSRRRRSARVRRARRGCGRQPGPARNSCRAAGGRGTRPARAAAGVVHGQRGDDRGGGRISLRCRGSRRSRPRGDPEPRAPVAWRRVTDPLAPEKLVPPTPGQLRRLMGAERLRPRRSLSQNFLTDPEALDTIVAAAELSPGDRVVEVGPGLGVLTRRLLAAGASVLAVELDPRLADYLRRELGSVDDFELIEADALSLHPREFFPGRAIKVVANIPYHITSPLLHTFLEGDRPPELTVLLVQLEVAERVAAPPGQMSYLSVFVQNVATAEVVARVPAAAFEPAPTVDSAVLRLRRREPPALAGGT